MHSEVVVYNLPTAHMEMVRQRAIEKALADAVTEGLTPTKAAKQAQKEGAKATKVSTHQAKRILGSQASSKEGAKATKVSARQAKRILGPIISSGWDFFEAMYFGGSMTEGFLRGMGTLFGTYVGGFHGEERLGKLGYLAGSHLGSWVGGRIGLMIYDVINGLNYMLLFVQPEYQSSSYASEEGLEYADNCRSGEGEDPTYYETSEEKYYETSEEKQEESKGFSLF